MEALPTVKVTFEILASELEDLQEMAQLYGVSENEIARRAIVTFKQLTDETSKGGDVRIQRVEGWSKVSLPRLGSSKVFKS